jgi:hypothetical protein
VRKGSHPVVFVIAGQCRCRSSLVHHYMNLFSRRHPGEDLSFAAKVRLVEEAVTRPHMVPLIMWCRRLCGAASVMTRQWREPVNFH